MRTAKTSAGFRVPSRLKKGDYELLAEFRYTLRRFLHFSQQAAKRYNATPQQYQVLLAIEGFPGRNHVTVSELAEQLQLERNSTVGLVNRLERIKLVRRETDSDDRRKVWVTLTSKGLDLLEKLYLAHRRELQVIGPQLAEVVRKAAGKIPDESL